MKNAISANNQDKSINRLVIGFVFGVSAAAAIAAAPATGSDVVLAVRDFETEAMGQKSPAVVYWGWTAQQKAAATEYSSIEIIRDEPGGEKCLKLTMSESIPPREDGYRAIGLSVDYLPPEADAVRLRVRVPRGRFTFSVGGPTVYFGHSDVTTQAISVDSQTHAQWSVVELSLNKELKRNYRRSQWAHNSPVIYYTRWIQEPLGIVMAKGSSGEILIDQVELIARGEGRPYPTFAARDIRTVSVGADFEGIEAMQQAFTVMTNVNERPKFDQGPRLVRKAWSVPRLARVEEGSTGRHSLEMVMTGTEEVCFGGVKVQGAERANAIALTLKAEHRARNRTGIVLDFVAYAAPQAQRSDFPWDGLRPPESWRASPDSFTYYLSPLDDVMKPKSFGLYHTRRTVPGGEWTTVVLPLADFICYYGQGEMAGAFQKQKHLTGDGVFALTFLSYYGQRSAPLRLLIDDIRFVEVPGTAEQLRSFYQAPAP